MTQDMVACNTLTFLPGFVQSRHVARVLAQVNLLVEQAAEHSWVMKWQSEANKWSAFQLSWNATRIWVVTSPNLALFVTGPSGVVCVATVGGATEEDIDPSEEGPKSRGPIRDLRGIGKALYVCGMGRQVYRRQGPSLWSRRDKGVLLPKGSVDVVGFNSIDGLGENDIYAVGFGGEIWRCVDANWHRIESPTNVILHRVRVITDELVYAAGQKGVILRGNGDVWEQIDDHETLDDLWGMEWFQERLYVSSDKAIFSLRPGGQITRLALPKGVTCGHLHAADGVMWSFGTMHLMWTEDGRVWNEATPTSVAR